MERIELNKIQIKFKSIKKFDTFKYMQLKKSIKKYGQLKPLLVLEDLTLIDGHLLYKCLGELKYDYVDIKKIIIDNVDEFRLSYNALCFDLNQIDFLTILKDLNINESNHIFPYTNEELKAYKNLLTFEWDRYKTKLSSKFIF